MAATAPTARIALGGDFRFDDQKSDRCRLSFQLCHGGEPGQKPNRPWWPRVIFTWWIWPRADGGRWLSGVCAGKFLGNPMPLKSVVVWDGEKATKGAGSCDPKGSTIGPQTAEAHSGPFSSANLSSKAEAVMNGPEQVGTGVLSKRGLMALTSLLSNTSLFG